MKTTHLRLRRMAMPIPARLVLILCLAAAGVRAQDSSPSPVSDPTRPSERMRDTLSAELSGGLQGLTLKGLVVASGNGGVALLDVKDAGLAMVKSNSQFSAIVGGVPFRVTVRGVSARGVELTAPMLKESVRVSGRGQPVDKAGAPSGGLQYVEFRQAALEDALRLIGDQSGTNFSATADAGRVPVSIFLRNVPTGVAVEEICRNHDLWFKADDKSGICRVMTMKEFERDLVSFHEETDEVFTLLYPNVLEVAAVIQSLYGDRVRLSLGRDGSDEAQDLASRFQRFDMINQRSQGFGTIQGMTGAGGIGTTVIAGNSGAVWSSSGGAPGTTVVNGTGSRNLTPEQAQQVQRALAGGASSNDAAQAQQVIQSLSERPAGINLTISRRNNMIIVRTSDTRAMEDIRSLVRRLDVPTSMVLLEVKILSLDLSDGFHSVFDYQFGATVKVGGESGVTTAGFTSGNIEPPPAGSLTPGGTGLRTGDMTFQVVNEYFRARIQLLESKNRVTLLATPLLLTANNEVSRLFLGEERPLVRNITGQTIITENSTAVTPNTTIEFRPVGTTLLITPNINSDRTVTLRLLQEDSSINTGGATIPIVVSSGLVQNVSIDVVSSRSISGTFVAKDDMAVAVGGLISEKISTEREQVPILGSIPLIGALFRRETTAKTRQELVIMIRPHVMSTPSDGEGISQTLLKDLSLHPSAPGARGSLNTFQRSDPPQMKKVDAP